MSHAIATKIDGEHGALIRAHLHVFAQCDWIIPTIGHNERKQYLPSVMTIFHTIWLDPSGRRRAVSYFSRS